MKYDAGAFAKYRNTSPIFRYLSQNPPRHIVWPDKWREELGILIATPGVSWRWIERSFNMTEHRLFGVFDATRHVHHLAKENLYSSTRDDALIYQKYNEMGELPFWVKPFILDDIKAGMKWGEVLSTWNISGDTLRRLRSAKSSGVLYIGQQPRWGRIMGR